MKSAGIFSRLAPSRVIAVGAIIFAIASPVRMARAVGLPTPNEYNTTPAPLDSVSADAPVDGPWDVPPDTNNVEPYGQCTYWAAEKRPDVLSAAQDTENYPYTGGAFDFEAATAAVGYPIDHHAQVGDVAAYPPNYMDGSGFTAGSDGHVAYVEQVNADGSFVVSEMNLTNWPLHGDLRFVPASAAQGPYFIHQKHPAFFTGEAALANGVYFLVFPSGDSFGYYSYLTNSNYIYHFDMGYEYVFAAFDDADGIYLYDFASNTFFYTSPSFPFPYLYDFTLNSVVYYYPDPNHAGHYTSNPRYLYVFNTGQIITK